MYVIANNISTRRPEVRRLFETVKKIGWNAECTATEALKNLARRCDAAGADAIGIDIQQHFDDPQAMAFAVTFVQQVTDKRLCLSAMSPDALEMGVTFAKQPPIVNYISIDDTRLTEILLWIAQHNADVILLASNPSEPSNADEMMSRVGTIVALANRLGVSNGHIIVDPGLYHVTQVNGQRHFADVIEFLKALPDTFGTDIRTSAWISNSSAGAPANLRPVIESGALAALAGAGLSSAFLDVLKRDNMRTVRLLKVLQNEAVYAEGDLKLTEAENISTYRLEQKQTVG